MTEEFVSEVKQIPHNDERIFTSLPFFAGMQGNGDKEVYGTYRAVIRLELSRYLSSE